MVRASVTVGQSLRNGRGLSKKSLPKESRRYVGEGAEVLRRIERKSGDSVSAVLRAAASVPAKR